MQKTYVLCYPWPVLEVRRPRSVEHETPFCVAFKSCMSIPPFLASLPVHSRGMHARMSRLKLEAFVNLRRMCSRVFNSYNSIFHFCTVNGSLRLKKCVGHSIERLTMASSPGPAPPTHICFCSFASFVDSRIQNHC